MSKSPIKSGTRLLFDDHDLLIEIVEACYYLQIRCIRSINPP
jgi:hypothetical protein